MINDFKKHLAKQSKLLKNAEALKYVLEGFQQRNEHITSNLPKHLPGREIRYNFSPIKRALKTFLNLVFILALIPTQNQSYI